MTDMGTDLSGRGAGPVRQCGASAARIVCAALAGGVDGLSLRPGTVMARTFANFGSQARTATVHTRLQAFLSAQPGQGINGRLGTAHR
ncbi:hypothetical protein [Streptomyces sp. NPDC088775]|uniref:hypothetical protein n=1 Tax=Streptomyces sp. NPDC088775 TaxID=3365896 RepID=UPI00380AC95C